MARRSCAARRRFRRSRRSSPSSITCGATAPATRSASRGPKLNLATMLCSIADVYDAMRSQRAYQGRCPTERILEVMSRATATSSISTWCAASRSCWASTRRATSCCSTMARSRSSAGPRPDPHRPRVRVIMDAKRRRLAPLRYQPVSKTSPTRPARIVDPLDPQDSGSTRSAISDPYDAGSRRLAIRLRRRARRPPAGLAVAAPAAAQRRPPPRLVVVVVDQMRYDYLDAHGAALDPRHEAAARAKARSSSTISIPTCIPSPAPATRRLAPALSPRPTASS